MIYPLDFEARIGFDKIRAQISALLQTASAVELLDAVTFSSDVEQVRTLTGETAEMKTILGLESDFPLTGFKDINYFLHRIRIEGSYLETSHIIDLATALELLRYLERFFAARTESLPYPRLAIKVEPIGNYDPILQQIDRIIDKFGKVRDSASPRLQEIRRSLADKSIQVSRKLQQILRSAQSQGFADDDSSITMRDGRALIPILSGSKRKIKGFIHSESATGKTSFIEPIEVVELNNEIKELEADERREIIKILVAFTDLLRPLVDELIVAGVLIAEIDLVIAKARWATSHDARLPIIESDPSIYLRQARHPLLEAALKAEKKTIVPLDLTLTPTKHILLISGPNAGGKSVCLKTVGLLQYMLQCGLLVTALDNSEMGIFDSIFLDIGDQQSLDNDLSTYSSHLINMKTTLRESTSRSLVLIDEFGSGTEPTTGGAIAESVLQKLVERRAFGVITTHYANLKYYAATADGIENGAMTFDLQQIRPLFRLEMGRAGSSFAFEIARKIGLPEAIITMATEKIGVEQISIEKQLKDATRDKRYWETKREKIRTTNKLVDKTAAEYEYELSEIQKERNRLIREAKEQAKFIIAEANRKIETTIREIREAQADKDRTRKIRSEIQEFSDALAGDAIDTQDPIERKIQLLREKEARRRERSREKATADHVVIKTPVVVERPKEIEVGFHVRLSGQQTIGQVLSISGDKVSVAFGQITTSVEKSRLEIVAHAEFKKQKRKTFVTPDTNSYDTGKQRLDFRQQIDVRGMRAVDALAAVEHFVDEAIMLGFEHVSILHGKGTGALKQEIRNYLGSQPVVTSARDEAEEFGGAGITVVKFGL